MQSDKTKNDPKKDSFKCTFIDKYCIYRWTNKFLLFTCKHKISQQRNLTCMCTHMSWQNQRLSSFSHMLVMAVIMARNAATITQTNTGCGEWLPEVHLYKYSPSWLSGLKGLHSMLQSSSLPVAWVKEMENKLFRVSVLPRSNFNGNLVT